MKRKGVTDEQLETIQIDPWPAGNFGHKWETEHRILKAIAYLRDSEDDNGYGRPVEGVMAVVDLLNHKVLEVLEEPAVPIPPTSLRFDGEHAAAHPRTDLKPLDIVQPEGVSFTLDGHFLQWQKWQMRVSLHPREGLVLHQIAYNDDGALRPICYRASMAEMVVPYGDPSITQNFKNAFDSGEVGGLGRLTNSLELGCDCLGEIVYLDGHVTNESGGARTINNAVCIHEEDFGILWKHTYDDGQGGPQSWVRRSRRLVVSAIATVGNYDYGFYWYFYQDGSWEHEVKATGIHPDDRDQRRRPADHPPHHPARPRRHHPPALLLLPPRHGGRWGRQQRLRDRHRSAAARPRQPPAQRLHRQQAPARERIRGRQRGQLRLGPPLADRQRHHHQPARPGARLRADPG